MTKFAKKAKSGSHPFTVLLKALQQDLANAGKLGTADYQDENLAAACKTEVRYITRWLRGTVPQKRTWVPARNALEKFGVDAVRLRALDAAREGGSADVDPTAVEASTGCDPDTQPTPGEREASPDTRVAWKTGRHGTAIFGLIEFRLRLTLNNPADTVPCPVHPVLIPGRSDRTIDGRTVSIGFRYLMLRYDSPGHTPREDSFLGVGEHTMPGVTRIAGGWRLEPPNGEEVLLTDPTRGASLFVLDGKGASAPPTVVELVAESGGVEIVDPNKPARSMKESRAKQAVLDAIFRERRDPEGAGRYVIGRGEVWQEELPG